MSDPETDNSFDPEAYNQLVERDRAQLKAFMEGLTPEQLRPIRHLVLGRIGSDPTLDQIQSETEQAE
jgi:hypothetical protein